MSYKDPQGKKEYDRKRYKEKKNDPEFMQIQRDRQRKWREQHPGYSTRASKKWRDENPDKQKSYYKKYYAGRSDKAIEADRESSRLRHEKLKNDPEYLKKRRNYGIIHRKENVEYYKNYRKEHAAPKNKERYANDIQYKLGRRIRGRLWNLISREQKVGSAVHDLGCTLEELKIHLENQFKEGMNWDNWKPDGWHIDHIKPLSKFDLTDPVQFKEAVHYTNLQPLWWNENLEKSDKWVDNT